MTSIRILEIFYIGKKYIYYFTLSYISYIEFTDM